MGQLVPEGDMIRTLTAAAVAASFALSGQALAQNANASPTGKANAAPQASQPKPTPPGQAQPKPTPPGQAKPKPNQPPQAGPKPKPTPFPPSGPPPKDTPGNGPKPKSK